LGSGAKRAQRLVQGFTRRLRGNHRRGDGRRRAWGRLRHTRPV